MLRHAHRLALSLLVLLGGATFLAAPAHAVTPPWVSLPGLSAPVPDHVREYTTGQIPTTVYAATEGDGVFRSTTGGVSWSAFNAGLEGIPGAKDVRAIYADGSRMLAGTSAGLFASTGGGAWQPVAQGPEDDPKNPKKLNNAVQAILGVTGGPLLVGGFSSGVWRSNDGGNTWIPPQPGNGIPPSTTVWSLTSFVPGTVLAATSSGIFRSLDGGASWTFAGDGIPATTLRIYKDTQNPLIYYAGTTDGVYRTVNAGLTWSSINGSGSKAMNGGTVRGMVIRNVASRTRIYAATDAGLWVGRARNDNVLNPGPVDWRHVEDTGLGGHNIFWTIAKVPTLPLTYIAGSDGGGGYALTLVPPSNDGTVANKPYITGTKTVGQTLTAHEGNWNGTKQIDYTFQWQRCSTSSTGSCTDIDGADQPTYTLAAADKNKWVRIVVTAENDVDTFISVDAGSDTYGSIGGDPTVLPGYNQMWNPTLTTGLKYSGDTLTPSGLLFNPTADSYTAKWFRCTTTNESSCVFVRTTAGVNGGTYTLTDADVTQRIRVKVTGKNSEGSATTDFSNPSNEILPKQATNLVAPFLVGKAEVGESLSANVGKWEYPGTTYARQWIRCEADGSSCETLSGQKGATYKLTAADLGKRMKAEIKADSNGDNQLPLAVYVMTPLSSVVVNPPSDAPAPPAGGGGAGGGGQNVVPPKDTTAPSLAKATLASSSIKRGGALTVAFQPTEGGKVKVQIQSLKRGRKKGKSCSTKAKKGKRCVIATTVLTKTVAAGASAGSVKIALKAGGKKLKAGRYQAVVTPIDGAGNVGKAKVLAFRIKR